MTDKTPNSTSGAASSSSAVPGAAPPTASLFTFDPTLLDIRPPSADALNSPASNANPIVPTPTQTLPFAAFGLGAAKLTGSTGSPTTSTPLGLPSGTPAASFSPWSPSPNSSSSTTPLRGVANMPLGATDLLASGGLPSPPPLAARSPNPLLTALSEASTPLLSEVANAAAFSRPAQVAAAATATAPSGSPKAAEIDDADDETSPAAASRRKRTASGTFKPAPVSTAAAPTTAPTPAALSAIASHNLHPSPHVTPAAVGMVEDEDEEEEDEESDTPGAADALTQFASHANGSSLIPLGAYQLVPSVPGMTLQDPNLSGDEEGTQAQFIDITHYLNMPQSQAAKKLGIPTSTLSKRWKEAVRSRKWPYRAISKLDKEIMTLLHNIPQNGDNAPLPSDIEATLGHLLRRRQEELKPVRIRIN